MTEIHTSHDVLVLGDRETVERTEMLAEKAADRGAVIAQSFAFESGEAAEQDNLTDVRAVVSALSRAIATRTDIWLPFPMQDLCREQHLRRLCVALQRHGLNLLMGPQLEPFPVEGGFSQIDAALRAEVRAVDELDFAALAAAGAPALSAQIEVFLALAAEQHAGEPAPDDADDDDDDIDWGPRYFSTAEAAAMLGKSAQWVLRRLKDRAFTYPDGTPVGPMRSGPGGGFRFTAPMLKAMAWSSYRRADLSKKELAAALHRLFSADC